MQPVCLNSAWLCPGGCFPSLNYSGAVLCTTKCYLSFGLELAVFKTGTFSLHKLVLIQREVVPPAAALPCPALSQNVIQDLHCNKKRLSRDTNFASKSDFLHFLQGFQCAL